MIYLDFHEKYNVPYLRVSFVAELKSSDQAINPKVLYISIPLYDIAIIDIKEHACLLAIYSSFL
jgi:hypothetical protein